MLIIGCRLFGCCVVYGITGGGLPCLTTGAVEVPYNLVTSQMQTNWFDVKVIDRRPVGCWHRWVVRGAVAWAVGWTWLSRDLPRAGRRVRRQQFFCRAGQAGELPPCAPVVWTQWGRVLQERAVNREQAAMARKVANQIPYCMVCIKYAIRPDKPIKLVRLPGPSPRGRFLSL